MCSLWELFWKSGDLSQWLEPQPSRWVDLGLEGQFLHQEIYSRVDLKAVKVVGITLQPHKEAAIRNISRTETKKTQYICQKNGIVRVLYLWTLNCSPNAVFSKRYSQTGSCFCWRLITLYLVNLPIHHIIKLVSSENLKNTNRGESYWKLTANPIRWEGASLESFHMHHYVKRKWFTLTVDHL